MKIKKIYALNMVGPGTYHRSFAFSILTKEDSTTLVIIAPEKGASLFRLDIFNIINTEPDLLFTNRYASIKEAVSVFNKLKGE